jgi:hypothetical protein
MKTIEDLTCEVTYTVGLGDLKVPDNVYRGLCEIFERGHKISLSEESEGKSKDVTLAFEWLTDNIREHDAMDWGYEIQDLT